MEGPVRTADLPGRLLGRQALEQTEDDRLAVPRGQPVDLFVDRRAEVVPLV